ncbi:MAG TPA: alpha/beta hydrolase, partial [Thermomicrobiales bacterium]|nr:alpha/beta hydrolase [Thermomicrobiales bacterium]
PAKWEGKAMYGEPNAAKARRTIETAAGSLAFWESGNPDAPPLVLLHGIGSRAESWWPVLDPLAERFRLHALDLRGHGGSHKPAAGYLIDDYAADLDAALDALGLDRPFVLGHSLGALTTLAWALAHPERASKIVVEDPPLRTEPEVLEAFDGWMQLNALPPEAAAAWYHAEYPEWTDEECRRRAESITSAAPAVFAEMRAFSATALADPQLARVYDLANLQPPTLLLRGDPELGSMTRPEDADRLAALAPDVQVAFVPGASHSIHRDQPEAFVAAVVRFLLD